MEKEFNEKSILKLVLKLGIPSMFAQLFNILYSIVDRVFIGNMPGEGSTALASIGVSAPLITAITAFATMVGIGGASYMSICMGRGDKKQAQNAVNNAMAMIVVISVAVTAIVLVLHNPILYALGCSDSMYPYASTYLCIYVSGTFFSLTSLGMNQFILAQGFAKRGMVAVVAGALLNVALDPLFIYVFDMGIAGAALATIISQFLAAVYVLYALRRNDMVLKLEKGGYSMEMVKHILSIGIMSFLITLLDNLILIIMNVQLRKYGGDMYGDTYIACASVVQSFMTVAFFPAAGITGGCGTLFSFHYGAKHFKKVMQTYKTVFALCAVYTLILIWVAQCHVDIFAGLFLTDPGEVAIASDFVSKYTWGLLGVAVQYALVDGTMAMGRIRYALPMSVFRKGIYLICCFVIPVFFALENIFYAGTISDIVGASFTAIFFFAFVRKRIEKELTPGLA